MTVPTLIQMERISSQTFLGLRFWDPVTDMQVVEGLRVRAQLLSDDLTRRVGKVVTAQTSRGGIYAFFGLQKAERADHDAALGQGVPSRRVAIDVEDLLGRYLPVAFQTETPLRDGGADVIRGPFRGEGLGAVLARPIPPANQSKGIYLWSAPARSTPAGQASIRGQVVVGNADSNPLPAAFALVEVLRFTNSGTRPHAYGVTDQLGRLNLPLAYPALADLAVGQNYPPLSQQTFSLQLHVFHRPGNLPPMLGSSVPDLALVLGQQQRRIASSRVLLDPADPGSGHQLNLTPDLDLTMRFGEPVLLRTQTDTADNPESFLRIEST